MPRTFYSSLILKNCSTLNNWMSETALCDRGLKLTKHLCEQIHVVTPVYGILAVIK